MTQNPNPNILPVHPPYAGDPYAEHRAAYPYPEPPAHMRQDGMGLPPEPAPVIVPEEAAVTYVCDLPPSRMLMSLTGFDEIAIAVRFGQKIGELREDAVTAGRAMAFVHMRRGGAKDAEAYEQAMNMTMREVVDYFAPEPREPRDQQLDDVTLLDGTTFGASAEGN